MIISKSARIAQELLKKYHIKDTSKLDLFGLVFSENALIDEKPIKGAEGRIVTLGNKSMIIINSNIDNEAKKRFVVAHELGHFKMHKDLSPFYNCSEQEFFNWHQHGSHETEANQFAVELLMPNKAFIEKSNDYNVFNLNTLKCLSDQFKTSLTATALRYSDIGKVSIATIFSQDNEVKWYSINPNFRYKYIKVNRPVPNGSVAHNFFSKGNVSDKPTGILAKTWFNDNFIKQDSYFYEQCLPINKINAVLSIIWECKDFNF
jgi:Zn-dependent peptidase ImmA (M78 family)